MNSYIVITIAYDNNPQVEGLKQAWGFACVIESLSERLLFDAGRLGKLLLANMAKLDLEPKGIDAVVLSHVDRDHTGGLAAFLQASADVSAFMPKTFPTRLKRIAHRHGAAVVETEGPCEVCPGSWTTGVLGNGIEEQGLYLKVRDGLVLVTGCAHPGIVRMAEAASRHAAMPVRAVLGGLHMKGASAREITSVIDSLKGLGVQRVAPCHCSGTITRRLMKESFAEGYVAAGVGSRLIFRTDPKEEP